MAKHTNYLIGARANWSYTHTQKGKLNLNQIFNDAKVKRIYVYWPSSVRIEKNFAQGLEHAASVHAFKTDGKVFLDVDQPRSVNNIIFFP